MKQLRNKLSSTIILLLFLFVAFRFATTTYAQQTYYPISQLGDCRDAQECFYYCEIPHNTPACWSYGKYVIERDVLGTSTKSPDEIAKEHGITFPVAELGNCASAQACMQYCNAPENQQTCSDFGKKKGLDQNNDNQNSVHEEKMLSDAKIQLGCDSKDSCMSYCSNPTNQQKCQQFAQSEGLNHSQDSAQSTAPSSTILQAAKQELGCDSQDTCMNYCGNPDNQQKCQAFAQAHNLTAPHSDQAQQNQQSQQSYRAGDSTPPCNNQDSCMKWCKDNPDVCKSMQQQSNQEPQYNQTTQQAVSPYPSYQDNQSNINQQQHSNNQQIPCSTDQECYKYCQVHPDQCPGFQQNNGTNGQYQQSGTQQGNYYKTPSISSQPPTQQQSQSTEGSPAQPQSNTQPSQNIPPSASDQEKMCIQTSGCSWTGSTCSCSSGY